MKIWALEKDQPTNQPTNQTKNKKRNGLLIVKDHIFSYVSWGKSAEAKYATTTTIIIIITTTTIIIIMKYL